MLQTMAESPPATSLSFWHHKKHEVDLILEKNGRRVAVEIKATDKPHQRDFSGLEAFCQKFPVDESYVVCRITRAQQFGRHKALSWQDWLHNLTHLFDPS